MDLTSVYSKTLLEADLLTRTGYVVLFFLFTGSGIEPLSMPIIVLFESCNTYLYNSPLPITPSVAQVASRLNKHPWMVLRFREVKSRTRFD